MSDKEWKMNLTLLSKGSLRLERDENGRTEFSRGMLYELRQYIKALEDGYTAAQKEVDLYRRLKSIPIKQMDELIERDRQKRPIIENGESVNFNRCPVCADFVFGSWKFCPGCGQRINWNEPAEEKAVYDGD